MPYRKEATHWTYKYLATTVGRKGAHYNPKELSREPHDLISITGSPLFV